MPINPASINVIPNNNVVELVQPGIITVQVTAPGPQGPQGPAGSGGTDTGSLLTTASVSLNTITFTKGNGTTFPITVDTGSGGGGGSGGVQSVISSSVGAYVSASGNNVLVSASIFQVSASSIQLTGSLTSSDIVVFSNTNNQFTGSLAGTSSWANNAVTASYILNAVSSSFASTASIALQVSTSISTQNTQHNVLFVDTTGPGFIQVDGGLRYNPNQDLLTTTSSYANQSLSASFATTASYVLQAVSSSFASTASNTPNAIITASVSLNTITFNKGNGDTFNLTVNTGSGGGGGSGFPFTGDAVITGSLLVSGSGVTITGSLNMMGPIIVPFNTQSANYTLQLSDAGDIVEINSGSANTVTIPTSSTVNFLIGTQITVVQYGTGQTTFTTGSTNVLLRSAGNATKLAAQYAGATLIKRGTDEWYLLGNVTV
jgi:hypothetical protein